MPILQQNGSYCFNSISCTLQTALKEIDIDSINKNGGCESDDMKDRLGTNWENFKHKLNSFNE